MSLALYLVGFAILIGGLAYAASLAGVDRQWIVAGVLVLLGIGIARGAVRTRPRD